MLRKALRGSVKPDMCLARHRLISPSIPSEKAIFEVERHLAESHLCESQETVEVILEIGVYVGNCNVTRPEIIAPKRYHSAQPPYVSHPASGGYRGNRIETELLLRCPKPVTIDKQSPCPRIDQQADLMSFDLCLYRKKRLLGFKTDCFCTCCDGSKDNLSPPVINRKAAAAQDVEASAAGIPSGTSKDRASERRVRTCMTISFSGMKSVWLSHSAVMRIRAGLHNCCRVISRHNAFRVRGSICDSSDQLPPVRIH